MVGDEAGCIFRLLGPVQVEVSGRRIPFTRRQQIGLLGYLLLHLDRVVPVDQIIDALWGEAVPSSAPSQVKNMMSSLRKTLVADGVPLVRVEKQPAGYRTNILTGQLDLAMFGSLAARARQAGESAEAVRLRREALKLWQGEQPLAGVGAPFAAAVRVHLNEQRNTLLEALFHTELSLGNHVGVVVELAAAVAADPGREKLVAHLMTALHRSGRTVEALAVFRRARQTLVDGYGVEPNAELRRLERMLLAGEPATAGEPPIVVRDPPPAVGVPAQLPMDVRGFVGRQAEMAALDALVAGCAQRPAEPVAGVVMGTAGVGKTTLAVHWAHSVSGRFPDGQLYLNLRGFGPSGQAMSTVEAIRILLDAFSIPPERIPAELDAQVALYRTLIAGRRMLVVLDNAVDTEQVSLLLPGTPGSGAIVTSRTHLTRLIVTQGALPLTLGVLDEGEARQLFVARLGLARVEADEAAVADIARRCARLPLALSLAAARAATHPGFSLAALCRELGETPGRLESLAHGDAMVDVGSVFSWSYQRLGAATATLFRLLGLHPSQDISVAAAASLARWSLPETTARMSELAHAHLIVEYLPGRFTMHDLLRTYALRRCGAEDSQEQQALARRRVLDHYLHTAYAAALMIYPNRVRLRLPPAQPGVVRIGFTDRHHALSWFKTEHQALLAAVELAADHSLSGHTWQLASATTTYLSRCGHWHDWVAVEQLAVKVTARLGDRAGQAHSERALGLAHNRLGRPEQAHRHLSAAYELQRQLGDRLEQAYTHLCIGTTYESQGDDRNGLAHAEAAFELYAAAENLVGQAQSSNSVGWFHARLGNEAEAIRNCERSVALYRKLGDRQGTAQALDSLGFARHRMGDHERAATAYRESVRELRAAGDHHHEAIPLTHLGETLQAGGDVAQARQVWREALDILERLGHPDSAKVRKWLQQIDPTGDLCATGIPSV